MEELVDLIKVNVLSKKQLFECFDKMLIASDIYIREKHKNQDNTMKYFVEFDNHQIELDIIIKNIAKSGWVDKPQIRRIQTVPLINIRQTTDKYCFILGGIAFYKEQPIFVCWDASVYAHHKSNRSCYVNVSTIYKAVERKYYYGQNSNQTVYLCDEKNIKRLILDFIKNNYSGRQIGD